MESARIVAWRYNYLQRLNKLRPEGSQIVFLDETWYDTHDVVRKGWDDGTCNCILKSPSLRGNRIMVLHAGGREGWVPNCLYLSARNIQDSKADSHDEMTGEVFENRFKIRLLQNLPRDKKCVIVMDNASYHSRQAIKFPTLRSYVKDIINFMQYHKIPVPHPNPIKAAMMQTIRKANINKTYIVDELANSYGHAVLRLHPYHCVLNPIELVWARLKSHVRKNNTTPTLSASVCEHLREGFENINSNLWSSCVDHTIKVGERYWIQDTTGDGERFIVDLRESDTDDE
ncbi:hypothetical protein ANN_28246 [Periplaneta americana]|uniref:Tc1-like transposase DDE domain-containing protein n=1 Tax=Periplaneta americana TaxID=6978 RepID=A0ABQ8RUH4_PERAM|nr:hypothetical protein ANN_28246 [Periplaneta americana]